MTPLLDATAKLLAEAKAAEAGPEAIPAPRHKPDLRHIRAQVILEKGVYVVKSEGLERLAEGSNINDFRVMLQLWSEMSRRGVSRQLEEYGINFGDTIRIGSVELEWS